MNDTQKLAQDAIDKLFKRLGLTYGAAWDRSMGQAPIKDVKTTWMYELDGFLKSRETLLALTWALENLPERCPNVIEFKNLCRRAPSVEPLQLEAPKADPERVKTELAKLAPARTATRNVDHGRDWARAIMRRHEAGDPVTPISLRFAGEALARGAALA